jgi:hypothetical protein
MLRIGVPERSEKRAFCVWAFRLLVFSLVPSP